LIVGVLFLYKKCQTLSKPSKHKNKAPHISRGIISASNMALISSAEGTWISLFKKEPLSTAQTIEVSRAVAIPVSC